MNDRIKEKKDFCYNIRAYSGRKVVEMCVIINMNNSILSIYSFLIKYSFLGEVNSMIDKKVVLITDKNEKINHADISNRNLEGNNAISTKTISEAIMSISKEFELITDVSKFLNSIYDYKDDIIFPIVFIWSYIGIMFENPCSTFLIKSMFFICLVLITTILFTISNKDTSIKKITN